VTALSTPRLSSAAIVEAADSRDMSAPRSSAPLVRLESLHRAFGAVVALDGVSLEIERGEIFGIIGRSGAGKSTLIRTINALERIDSGRIIVDGNDLTSLDEAGLNRVRRKIGMIFQHFNLLAMKTVFENVELPLKLAGEDRDSRARRVERLLDLVGLRDKADAYPAKLSGGQKQRVGIARALASGPSLLLSDEATSALDPETTLSILRLLKELKETLGVTIVLITHEMSVIREICDRVAVLDHGRIVEQGAVWEVLGHPRTDLTQRLLRNVRPPLPQSLQREISAQPISGGRTVLRIGCGQHDQYEYVLARLAADPQWHPRILHGELDRIADHPIGTLTFSVAYRGEAALQGLLAAISTHTGEIQVLGHVTG
jgi:D-methionine transport system ATP-binding protein